MILPPPKRKNSGRRTSFRGQDEEEGGMLGAVWDMPFFQLFMTTPEQRPG